MDGRTFFDRKDENVVVEELSSLTIPEDQMVTVQEEIITTGDSEALPPINEPVLEEVMDEGQAPKRDPEQIAAIEKRRKLTLKPKPTKSEGDIKKKKKVKEVKKGQRRVTAYLMYSRHMRSSVSKDYPGRHTAKFLVGVTPCSTIVFVSAAYPGNTSDKQLVIACNILDHLVAGDGIMADKGFLIDDILPDELKQSEITSKLGKMWSELDDADKEYWKSQESEENAQVVVTKKKKKKTLAPLPPDEPPQALDLAAHLKLLGDSITKMGEITSELYERDGYRELTVSALLTNLLDCLLCASAPLLYLSSHIEQLDVIPVEKQVKMLDNVAYIMPGLENFKA